MKRLFLLLYQLIKQEKQHNLVETMMYFGPWFFRLYIFLARRFPKLFPDQLSRAVIVSLGYSTLTAAVKHELLTAFPANNRKLLSEVIDTLILSADYRDPSLINQTCAWIAKQTSSEDEAVARLSRKALDELRKYLI